MTDGEYKEFDKFLNETRFDVNEIMDTKKRFEQVYDLLYDYMKAGFEEERVRKHPLYYAFSNNPDEVMQMEVRHFIVNMLFWYPMTRIGVPEKLNKSFVVDCSCLNKKQMKAYFDEKIIIPFRDYVTNMKLNQIFADTTYRLGLISLDFNEIMGISINIQTFIGMAKKYPEFDDCIHTKVDPNMQPSEIEMLQHDRMNKIIALMKKHENDIRPILNSGEGIKDKQLSEFAVIGGLKPDMVGNTIPKPIDTNFIVGGLNSVSNFFIDKQAGRKAVVANKTLMGNAGYFAAKIMKVTKDTRLDMNVEECGTHHPILYNVKDKDHLKIIDHQYYYLIEDPNNLRVVSKKDDWLIGKMIYLRLPVTCGLGHNRVCRHCYGEMYKVNGDPDFGQGSFASAISANKYQQDTLSTKHLMTTNSVPIEFPDIFNEVFSLEANIIAINPEKIEEPKRWTIIIDEERMVEYDQVEFNSHTSQIILRDNKTKEEYIIEEANGSEIFLYQDIINKFTHKAKQRIELDPSKLDDTVYLGIIVVENNELTKPLKHMQKLLDTNDHLGCQTVDELVNRMTDLMIEANMGVLLVHGGMILKNLIRRADNIYEYPSFASFRPQNYKILKLTDALVNSPSLTTGLASQDLRKQFSEPQTYKKCAKASTDVYFRKSLYGIKKN